MPRDFETRFTIATPAVAGEVQRLVESRRSLYQERDQVMHDIRRYRLMRQQPWLPTPWLRRLTKDGAYAPKLPLMYRVVQTAVSAIAKDYPSVYVDPLSPEDREGADRLARAYNLLLQTIDRTHNSRFFYSLYYKLLGDGLGVVKVLDLPWKGWPVPPERPTSEEMAEYSQAVAAFLAERPYPFYVAVVDPLTFYPPLDEYGEGPVVEIASRRRDELESSLGVRVQGNRIVRLPEGEPYPQRELPPGASPQIETAEVWTKDYYAVSVSGQVILFENQYGESPYAWGYAEPTGVDDPTNVGMSVAYPLYYLAPQIDTLLGIYLGWAMMALPTPYTTQQPVPGVSPTQETSIQEFEPGLWHHFATGRQPGMLTPPAVGPALLGYLQFLLGAADRGGLPPLVSGDAVGSRLPALTFASAYAAATDRLAPTVKSAENIVGSMLRKIGKIVVKYERPLPVNGWEHPEEGVKTRGWATLDPAEVERGRNIVVTLAVDNTQDLIAKGTHAQFMKNSRLWSVRRAARFSGVQDVDQEMDEIAADLAWEMALPMKAQLAIRKDPELAEAMRAEEAAAQQAPPVGPPGGPLPGPPVPAEEGVLVGNGPGRNRPGVPAGRGGGRRAGLPTERPRGNRHSPYGRT